MNKLKYRGYDEEKIEIDPFLDTVCPPQGIPRKKKSTLFLDTVCPFRASRVKPNRPVFRHGMPPRASRVKRNRPVFRHSMPL